MAVTRLKRKTAKNKIKAKKRVADLKRLNFKANIPSPYKGESGIILEDQVKYSLKDAPAKDAPVKVVISSEEE